MKSWLCEFLSSCLHNLKISKIWKRALVVAILKPNKHPKCYWSISLLCIPYMILERVMYTFVESTIDPLLHREQDGFWHGRPTVVKVILLTHEFEESFLAKKKAIAVFIDLTATYNTVWHHSLTCRLLHLLPDRCMVKMIMELVTNHSFTLITRNGTFRRLRCLKNGVPQGSVFLPPPSI